MPPASARSFSDQLRDAIAESGLTARELGKLADLDDGIIGRFLNHERGLTTASIDKLAEVLGLRLVEGRGRARTTARPVRTPRAKAGPAGA